MKVRSTAVGRFVDFNPLLHALFYCIILLPKGNIVQ